MTYKMLETTHEVSTHQTCLGPEKILTVAELLDLLSVCDPNDQVVIGTQEVGGEWCNVSHIELPNENEGYLAVTLMVANTFDPRQF